MTKIQSMSENMAARALLAELHELREYRAKTESLLAQVAEQMEKGAKHISTMEKRLTMEREMTTDLLPRQLRDEHGDPEDPGVPHPLPVLTAAPRGAEALTGCTPLGPPHTLEE